MGVRRRFGKRFLFMIRGFRLRLGLYSSRLIGFKIDLGFIFKSIKLMPHSVFDSIVGNLMDPSDERRDMKARKAHYDTLHFVTDSMQGIQERCVCGQRLLRERAPAEVFDYLPGKRFFTCKNYKVSEQFVWFQTV